MTAPLDPAAQRLRAEFDASFAAPPRAGHAEAVALLALRVAGEAYACRVAEARGLLLAPPVVAVPSRRPELLGVAAVRGVAVPVYSLARLLGRGAEDDARWLLLAGDGQPVGFAFSAFDGQLLVPAADIDAAAPGGDPGHVVAIARCGGAPRPLLGIPSLVRAIGAPLRR